MSDLIAALLLSNFELFVRVAFRYLHDGRELGDEPYIQYLCARLMRAVEPGARTVLNLPPRHLKTLLSAVFLPAWLLARDPTEKIIILAYSEQIARDSAYLIRKLLQWDFYQKIFSTRLAADRTRVCDFFTEAGGGVYAVGVDGSVTGRGATLIIFDDPVAIADCANLERLATITRIRKSSNPLRYLLLASFYGPRCSIKTRTDMSGHRSARESVIGCVSIAGYRFRVFEDRYMTADRSGTLVSRATPMGERRATLSLKTDGSVFKGGQIADDGKSAEIFDGTVDGNQVSWKVAITDPMPPTLEFNGTVNGDEVSGNVTLGNFGSSTFSGTRS